MIDFITILICSLWIPHELCKEPSSFLNNFPNRFPAVMAIIEAYTLSFLHICTHGCDEAKPACFFFKLPYRNNIIVYNTARRANKPTKTGTAPPLPAFAAPLLLVGVGDANGVLLTALPELVGLAPATTELTTPVAALVPITFPAAAQGVRVKVSPDSDCE